jgi:hypothetical protein
MANLTKYKADEIATAMTAKEREKFNALSKQVREQVVATYLTHLPDEIVTIYHSKPQYLNTTGSLRIDGNGFNNEYFRLFKSVPQGENSLFMPKPAEAKVLRKSIDLLESKEIELKELKRDIYNALITLKTVKRISEQLPEAIPFLNLETQTAVTLNLTDLRKRLK